MREIVEMVESGLAHGGGPSFQVIGHYYLQNGKITYDGVDAAATRKMKWLLDNNDAYVDGKSVTAAERPIAWFYATPTTFSGLGYHVNVVT